MGKVDVKPSLFSKRSLLTNDLAARTSIGSTSGVKFVPNKPKLEKDVYQKNSGTCKPSLFDKSLAVKSKESGRQKTVVPSLFSTESLLSTKGKDSTLIADNSRIQTERNDRKRKLNYTLSKQSSLEKVNTLKIPAKVIQNAGKRKKTKNVITYDKKNGSKKKIDIKLKILTEKIKEFKLADNDFKKDQLQIMRNKLKLESEGLFVDSKQENFNIMKQEKEKLIKEKVNKATF